MGIRFCIIISFTFGSQNVNTETSVISWIIKVLYLYIYSLYLLQLFIQCLCGITKIYVEIHEEYIN